MSKQSTEYPDRSVAEWFERALAKAHVRQLTPDPCDSSPRVASDEAVAEFEPGDELRSFEERLERANQTIDAWMRDELEGGAALGAENTDSLVSKLYEELQQWVEEQPKPAPAAECDLDQMSAEKEARRRAEQQANDAMMADVQSLLAGPLKGPAD